MSRTKTKDVVMRLIMTNRMHRKLTERRAAANTDIQPSQHRMLMYLSKNEIVPSQREIAEKFEISPAAVTVTIKKLEKMGYVEKNRLGDDGDGRVNEIRITEKGKKEADATLEYFTCIDKHMFEDFTDEEMDELMRLLDKASANLQRIEQAIEEHEK